MGPAAIVVEPVGDRVDGPVARFDPLDRGFQKRLRRGLAARDQRGQPDRIVVLVVREASHSDPRLLRCPALGGTGDLPYPRPVPRCHTTPDISRQGPVGRNERNRSNRRGQAAMERAEETTITSITAELDRCFSGRFKVLILDNEVTVDAFVADPPLPWARFTARGGVYRIGEGYPGALTAAEAAREELNWDPGFRGGHPRGAGRAR